MDLHTLQQEIIKEEGGIILKPYKDHLGYWTIGYGKLVDPEAGGGLTEHEAQFLLKNTLSDMWDELESSLPWITEKHEHVQEALLNMCYNLGITRLLKFKKMLAAIEADNPDEAYAQALDSKWARQVGQRAQRIADIFKAEL